MTAMDGRTADKAETRLAFWWGLLVRLTVTGLSLYFLWRVRTILTTVIVSLIISCAAQALVKPLCRHRVRYLTPHTQRFVATILVFVLLFGGAFWTVSLLLRPFQTETGKLIHNYPTYQTALMERVTQAKDWYDTLPPDLRRFAEEQKTKLSVPTPTAWLTSLLGTTLAWASHVVELILVPVLAFYFTLDGRALRNQFLFLVPQPRLRDTLAILKESGVIMRAYIVSQFWLAVIAGVVVGVGLRQLGMDYALVLGLWAGITRAIPVIGPLLGGIPVVLLSLVFGAQHGQPLLWIGVLTFFTLLHLIESKIVMPRFLGHALDLHAVVIIIALLIGGEFFGLMGMFLAAPIAALGRILIRHYVILPRRRAAAFSSVQPSVTHFGNSARILRFERSSAPLRSTTSSRTASLSSTATTTKE